MAVTMNVDDFKVITSEERKGNVVYFIKEYGDLLRRLGIKRIAYDVAPDVMGPNTVLLWPTGCNFPPKRFMKVMVTVDIPGDNIPEDKLGCSNYDIAVLPRRGTMWWSVVGYPDINAAIISYLPRRNEFNSRNVREFFEYVLAAAIAAMGKTVSDINMKAKISEIRRGANIATIAAALAHDYNMMLAKPRELPFGITAKCRSDVTVAIGTDSTVTIAINVNRQGREILCPICENRRIGNIRFRINGEVKLFYKITGDEMKLANTAGRVDVVFNDAVVKHPNIHSGNGPICLGTLEGKIKRVKVAGVSNICDKINYIADAVLALLATPVVDNDLGEWAGELYRYLKNLEEYY